MSFEYSSLTEEQRKQIIEDRLRQFEAEHFNHELNKLNLETLPDSKEKQEQIKAADEAQSTLEQAIKAHRDQLK